MRERTGLPVALVVALFLLLAHAVRALTTEESPNVMVVRDDGRIAVTITRATDLRNVLEAVCSQANLQCQIGDGTEDFQVEPTVVAGSWGRAACR